jgi:hypothetical protein
MNQALQADDAWETLHGKFEVPKKYVPPFLQEERKQQPLSEEDLDYIYKYEVEGVDPKLK